MVPSPHLWAETLADRFMILMVIIGLATKTENPLSAEGTIRIVGQVFKMFTKILIIVADIYIAHLLCQPLL